MKKRSINGNLSEEEVLMKCPYCDREMVVGSISQDRYALKWIPADKDKGLLNFTPFGERN